MNKIRYKISIIWINIIKDGYWIIPDICIQFWRKENQTGLFDNDLPEITSLFTIQLFVACKGRQLVVFGKVFNIPISRLEKILIRKNK